jgi:hypothetical protein
MFRMNDEKLKKLFELARAEAAPIPPEGFDSRVIRALASEIPAPPISLWDQIEALFPRVAMGTALVMLICLLGDFCYSAAYPAGLSGDVNEISEQWLLGSNVD